jgi:hypothetical protein
MKRIFSLLGGLSVLGLFWYALSAEQNTENDQTTQGQQVYNDFCATCLTERICKGGWLRALSMVNDSSVPRTVTFFEISNSASCIAACLCLKMV